MTFASAIRSSGVYWIIPRRQRALAKLVHGLCYLRIFEKLKIIRDVEVFNIVINVENLRNGTIDSYYMPISNKLIEEYHNLGEFISSILTFMREKKITKDLSLLPIEVSMYFRFFIFDKPSIGYIKTRYNISDRNIKGDVEINLVKMINESYDKSILLGNLIAKAFIHEILDKKDVTKLLTDSLYLEKSKKYYLKSYELKDDFIRRSLDVYRSKMIAIAKRPDVFKSIVNRYGIAVRDIQSLAKEMREFLSSSSYKTETGHIHKYLDTIEQIKPILLPYRLDFIKPLFKQAKEITVATLRELNVPIVETSSLIVFDHKVLYSLTYAIAKGLLKTLTNKYKRILEGSTYAWQDIERMYEELKSK